MGNACIRALSAQVGGVKRIVTFTNLFPNSVQPTHGLFIYERMHRVAQQSGLAWSVVAPLPNVVWPLRFGVYRQQHAVPLQEQHLGCACYHPRYRHWPGCSQRAQASRMAQGAREVVQQLAAAGPIVLDAHYLWPDGVAAAMLAEALGVPFTWTARGSDAQLVAQDPVVLAHLRRYASKASFCAAVSSALADCVADVTQLPRERIVTLRNGVDLQRFAPRDAQAARQQLGWPQGPIVLGVGRLVPNKGFLLAAQALTRLPDAQLVLIGTGPQRDAITRVLGSRVRCLGACPPNVVALAMQAADVLVLPTEREGWPNVVTEALASGLRVVATPVGGIPEILGGAVPDARLGALVEVGNVLALEQALRQVLAVQADRAFVAQFAQQYGWEQPVAWLSERFSALLEVA